MSPESKSHLHPQIHASWPHSLNAITPVHAKLIAGWSSVEEVGDWAVDRLFEDLRPFLLHAQCSGSGEGQAVAKRVSGAAFKLKSRALVTVECHVRGHGLLRLWSRDPEKADEEFGRFRQKYLNEKKPSDDANAAAFYVIRWSSTGPESRLIRTRSPDHTASDLRLHYGEEFVEWHLQLMQILKASQSGLTILRGEAGTGKTSYLRAIMAELRRSHRFFYLPVSSFDFLVAPSCTDFWLEQAQDNSNLGKVCIIWFRCSPTCWNG